MYDYYDYSSSYAGAAAAGVAIGGAFIVMMLISLAISVFEIVCLWKVYTKAGKPGWAAIVPIYNIIVLLEMAELPLWYIALFFVPFANIYALFKIYIELAHKFGKSTGFGVGLVFLAPIFMAILAFDKSAVYNGTPVAPQAGATATPVQPAQPAQSRFCPNCGAPIVDGATFCGSCGTQL